MRKLLFFSIISALFAACSNGRFDSETEFELKGYFENAENLQILFEELTTSNLVPLDTITADANGHFTFRSTTASPGFFILRIDRSNFVTLLLEPGQKVSIEGDGKDLPKTYKVKGSPGSDLLAELNMGLHAGYNSVDSLADVFREIQGEPDFLQRRQQIDLAYTRIFEQQQQFVKNFIGEHPQSLASIIALYQFFGNQVLLKETEHFEYFEKLSESLSEVYPDNKHVLDLKRRVNELKRTEGQRLAVEKSLAIGNEAPEIVLTDPDGSRIALSSLRGKVVLLDFWAAWCNPCRVAHPRLKEIYNRYRQQGFEIYAISLDRNREQWVQGIKEDNINWIQVSDLRFWNSPVVNLYNVEAIPYNILLDREGRILAKGLNMNQLEEFLSEIFR